MKTKAQKKEALDRGAILLESSKSLIFTDFSQMATNDVNALRRQVKAAGGTMLVIKKRLLSLLAKERNLGFDLSKYKVSVGTIFSPDGIDVMAGPVFRFFKEKKTEQEKLLGGYDMAAGAPVSREQLLAIGVLPPREVLLGQLFGTIAGPLRAFLYLLDQKSKKGSES